jgi:hypothetical protein
MAAILPLTPASHLDELNAEQRRAAVHGSDPLLVIAGAGSGKTKAIVHRLVHLIEMGTDPRRILLLTFSRRAAAETARRVEQIAARTMGQRAALITDALSGSGTFHAVGARFLREYAEEIGLDPSFTIHDREDSADLMNMVRSELGYQPRRCVHVSVWAAGRGAHGAEREIRPVAGSVAGGRGRPRGVLGPGIAHPRQTAEGVLMPDPTAIAT